MASTIKHIRTSVAGRIPTASDLELGELGINTTDGKVFIKKDVSGTETIVDIGGGPQTAAEILAAVKTVDGTGSGLDADTLDGQEGSHYLNYSNLTNKPTIPAAYTDSDVDTHLNSSTASNGEVLSWTGSDYDWVAQSGGGSSVGANQADYGLVTNSVSSTADYGVLS